jgi:hypothetical protein
LWLERADVVFAADALTLGRSHRLRRPRPAPQRFEVERLANDSAGAPAWRPALGRLAALLAAERPAAARVRLSGQFCRFALAPWNRGLSADEEQALARAVFLETYGDAARGWEVRVDNLNRGGALVVCAVDADLVASLAAAFTTAGWRLESVEPLFAAALERAAAASSGADAAAASWHALLENDWCSAALVEGDTFLSVCAAAVVGSTGALARTLENENVRLSRKVRALRLLPGSVALPAAEDFSGWRVTR